MQKIRILLIAIFCLAFFADSQAHIPPTNGNSPSSSAQRKLKFRGGDCAQATMPIDQAVNNVRARLLNGGDVWWDGNSNGRYIVPKVPPGEPEISSIFAGAVWIGGLDPAGSLKVAAQSYGTSQGQTDFWPGPLNQFDGTTDRRTCSDWDKFFKVTATEIDEHLRLLRSAQDGEIVYTPDLIPAGVKGWPAQGNPHFIDEHNFELPRTGQGLAGYYDENRDGIYDPLDGDYPIIEIRGCTDWEGGEVVNGCERYFEPGGDKPQYPNEMIFWIYNDAGGIHTESNGDAIQMEVQVQAFAYATNDFINDMTFQRYKLINRAIEDIRDCYFAMWVDPDLGCSADDYVGCDTLRSLAYVYNQDAADGETGCTCTQGVNTYCTEIPILGVDYFRGPRAPVACVDDNGNVEIDPFTGDTIFKLVELGMSSFTYSNRQGGGGGEPTGTTDPQTAQEYYNYLTGKWRDGSTFQFGGIGYNTGGREIKYAFPSPPDCSDANNCWSMCSAQAPIGDRRTLQATGPFVLKPNAVNELIIGVVWLPLANYPCPDITRLQKADDVAQSLFDNCFEITDGPDAPDVDWLELDREIVGILTNDLVTSNNANEAYSELDLQSPSTIDSLRRLYRFEGYKVFQLTDGSVSVGDLTDPSKAKLVFQSDVDNGIGKIYNWTPESSPFPGEPPVWTFEERVLSASPDQGIRHTFKISEDLFALNDRRLVNHKKYYYMAVAYAHNSWERFDPNASGGQGTGQTTPYLEGRRNIKIYTVIPRPIVDRALNAQYGDGAVVVTRIDGVGNGGNFLDMTDETRVAIEIGSFGNKIKYKAGRAPISVTIFNPLDVKNGRFRLTFYDDNMGNSTLDRPARWRLTNLENPSEIFESESTIDRLNEQILAKYGFSITVGDVLEPGADIFNNPTNGVIGYEEEYADPFAPQWLAGLQDGFGLPGLGIEPVYDYVSTGPNEDDNNLDPNSSFSKLGRGFFQPYYLLDYRTHPNNLFGGYLTPAWTQQGGLVRQQMLQINGSNALSALNNVDIVFTSDTTLWSRCVVVEGSSPWLTQFGLTAVGNRPHFELRASPSVSRSDKNGDELADPDGDGEGMGWFPGYAVDVETGKRLNIFFSEASIYRCDEPLIQAFDLCNTGAFEEPPTGADMMWNPNSQGFIETGTPGVPQLWQFMTGGLHYIYVTNQEYDGCNQLRGYLAPGQSALRKVLGIRNITWAGFPIPPVGESLNSYKDGLIPNELTVKLRVNNSFKVARGTGDFNGYPTYEFALENVEAKPVTTDAEINEALDAINIVPNPYYGFSAYENSQFSTRVRITNLPAKCKVTIYTLDGKFIRQYSRDERGIEPTGSNRGIERSQIIPHLEWDLRNGKGIPVASGVYLIHVDANELGSRTLKWFGIQRQFDPSGL